MLCSVPEPNAWFPWPRPGPCPAADFARKTRGKPPNRPTNEFDRTRTRRTRHRSGSGSGSRTAGIRRSTRANRVSDSPLRRGGDAAPLPEGTFGCLRPAGLTEDRSTRNAFVERLLAGLPAETRNGPSRGTRIRRLVVVRGPARPAACAPVPLCPSLADLGRGQRLSAAISGKRPAQGPRTSTGRGPVRAGPPTRQSIARRYAEPGGEVSTSSTARETAGSPTVGPGTPTRRFVRDSPAAAVRRRNLRPAGGIRTDKAA